MCFRYARLVLGEDATDETVLVYAMRLNEQCAEVAGETQPVVEEELSGGEWKGEVLERSQTTSLMDIHMTGVTDISNGFVFLCRGRGGREIGRGGNQKEERNGNDDGIVGERRPLVGFCPVRESVAQLWQCLAMKEEKKNGRVAHSQLLKLIFDMLDRVHNM